MKKPSSIPRPLVRTNQWFIVISAIAAWATGVFWLLALPLLAGILGMTVGFNPVMRTARLFLHRHPSQYVQEDTQQQQFNQVIAVICLAIALMGYALKWTVLAYVFSAVVTLAAFIAILGFCVGCFIRFQWKQYRYRRSTRRTA